MPTYDRIRKLPLVIEGYELEGLEADVSSEFTRLTTVIRLHGDGHDGIGEDVTYDAVDHEELQDAGAVLPLAGTWTVASFSAQLDTMALFPAPPQREVSLLYRRWAFESAALDLALRQAGAPLHELLERPCEPVRYVVSLRLGEPPSMAPLRRLLARDPHLRFKLDPTASWDAALVAELAASGVVEAVDFKGLYEGTVVDQTAGPELYRLVAEGLPGVWIEDPKLTPEVDALLAPERDRITWDVPIHSAADIEALPFPPRTINVKPSRFGALERLLDAYDLCESRGIGAYGGGQFELGPGRGQIQYLASLFHADAPNDVAPSAYNDPEPSGEIPASPLTPRPAPTGFRWEG